MQRKRTKGWKSPPNTVYVGRPTWWGNPWKVGLDGDQDEVVRKFRAEVMRVVSRMPLALEGLRGKNLSCWCSLHSACHADVLLEFANRKIE